MARKLRMSEMTPDSASEGTVMVSGGAISPGEVEDRLKDTLGHPANPTSDLVIVYPVLGHPLMRSDTRIIELVSCVTIYLPAKPALDLTMVVCSPTSAFKPRTTTAGGCQKEGEKLHLDRGGEGEEGQGDGEEAQGGAKIAGRR